MCLHAHTDPCGRQSTASWDSTWFLRQGLIASLLCLLPTYLNFFISTSRLTLGCGGLEFQMAFLKWVLGMEFKPFHFLEAYSFKNKALLCSPGWS